MKTSRLATRLVALIDFCRDMGLNDSATARLLVYEIREQQNKKKGERKSEL